MNPYLLGGLILGALAVLAESGARQRADEAEAEYRRAREEARRRARELARRECRRDEERQAGLVVRLGKAAAWMQRVDDKAASRLRVLGRRLRGGE